MTSDLLARILEGLDQDDRTIVRLLFVEQRSYAEVARLLRVPEGTVKSRMSRCKDRMLQRRRELLGGQGV